jgi:hypothetical protein
MTMRCLMIGVAAAALLGCASCANRSATYLELRATQTTGYPIPTIRLTVINDTSEAFAFDIRPLTTLKGVMGRGVNGLGQKVSVMLHPVTWPWASVAKVDFGNGMVPAGLQTVTLEPGDSFSWPARVGSRQPMISRMCAGNSIASCRAVLTLANGTQLTSNTVQPVAKKGEQLPPHSDESFNEHLDAFRKDNLRDVGVRVIFFRLLTRGLSSGSVSEKKFGELLKWAIDDPSPLVRADAAWSPAAWQALLVDTDPAVRRVALWSTAWHGKKTKMPQLAPLLLARAQEDDAEMRCLALKALARHADGDTYDAQVREAAGRAANDPDPKVQVAARKYLSGYLKN